MSQPRVRWTLIPSTTYLGLMGLLFVFVAFLAFVWTQDARFTVLALLALNALAVILAFLDALTRDDLNGAQRLAWGAIVVLATPIVAVGAITYFAMGRERTRRAFTSLREPPAAPRS